LHFGFVPCLLENVARDYINPGPRQEYPNSQLPSEYFRRQVFGGFWLEKETLALGVPIETPFLSSKR
jgi:hypothetical protein